MKGSSKMTNITVMELTLGKTAQPTLVILKTGSRMGLESGLRVEHFTTVSLGKA